MQNEINEPKDLLPIIQEYIERKIDDGISARIHEFNEPDGAVIWECILRALEKAKVPYSKWDSIRKHVEKVMRKEGFKFTLG